MTVSEQHPRAAGGSTRARRNAKSSGPVAYDFRRPVKLSREHSRTLQLGFETFARQASTLLTSTLRSVSHVSLLAVEQMTYHEYVESLSEQTYMTMFSLEPVQHTGMFEMPIQAAMACVDHMLGGPGSMEQPQRHLTEIEGTIVQGLVGRLLAELRYALSSLVEIEPVVLGVEYSPQFAQMTAASDVMIVASFEYHQGNDDHSATICLPFSGLLPFLTASTVSAPASARERAQRELASSRLAAELQEVPIDVSVRFRGTTADPVELSNLQVGDVVRLQHPSEAPLDVTAAEVVFAHATAGTQGARLACLVVAQPTKEN